MLFLWISGLVCHAIRSSTAGFSTPVPEKNGDKNGLVFLISSNKTLRTFIFTKNTGVKGKYLINNTCHCLIYMWKHSIYTHILCIILIDQYWLLVTISFVSCVDMLEEEKKRFKNSKKGFLNTVWVDRGAEYSESIKPSVLRLLSSKAQGRNVFF